MAAQFGRRLRKSAATTAVTAVAMAALTASQAPSLLSAEQATGGGSEPVHENPIDGGSPYHTDLPPLNTPNRPGTSIPVPGRPEKSAEAGLPASVLAAYKKAEKTLADRNPGCNLPWELLAAIGKVESGQARGGSVDAEGTTLRPILGPKLDGNGFARITDTDGGKFDGDTTHDRAVGPMQFIPSTWKNWGADGNGDGAKNPNNIYDAALAAGRYLCAAGRDLSVPEDRDHAILGYNHSEEYLRTVLSWFEYYRKGTHEVPDGTGVLPVDVDPDPVPVDRNRARDTGGKKGDQGGKGSSGRHGSGKPGSDRPHKPGDGADKPDRPSEPNEPQQPGDPTGPGESTPASRVTALQRIGARNLTATAGTAFTEVPRVRAEDAKGKPVAKVPVRFEIRGGTDTRFPDGATRVTVLTGADGTARAPKLLAGERAGTFTLHAGVEGRLLLGTDCTGTVEARPAPQADALVRVGDAPLTAPAGGAFAAPLEVRATYRGQAAAGVPVTASFVTSGLLASAENDEGPFFKDAAGKPVRTLKTLKTGANGVLKLPKIYTDDRAGTFRLRVTTAEGTVLTVELTVTEATTPAPGTPAPGTPAPGTSAPGTPAPETSAPKSSGQ
ncbi:lytic transglycosylase [Streptomyces sp. NPDC002055]|uniref:lytic transglycosylase domain-containing protein n=1 Tax=Streptomyces sp. NPDC002055 TaxID=3154534 RepID=UPI00332D52C9